MTADQKNALDAKIEALTKTPAPDVIELHVIFNVNREELANMLVQAWQSIQTGSIPKDFFLITDKGAHVLPSSYTFIPGADHEFDLTFPRLLNGEPIFGSGTKSIKIQFLNPAIGDFGTEKKTVEFKFDRMVVDGKPAY